jgi:hypothetical protein
MGVGRRFHVEGIPPGLLGHGQAVNGADQGMGEGAGTDTHQPRFRSGALLSWSDGKGRLPVRLLSHILPVEKILRFYNNFSRQDTFSVSSGQGAGRVEVSY